MGSWAAQISTAPHTPWSAVPQVCPATEQGVPTGGHVAPASSLRGPASSNGTLHTGMPQVMYHLRPPPSAPEELLLVPDELPELDDDDPPELDDDAPASHRPSTIVSQPAPHTRDDTHPKTGL